MFTRYKMITDGELWAIKRTRLMVLTDYAYFHIENDESDIHHWNHRPFAACWVPKERAELHYRRLTA